MATDMLILPHLPLNICATTSAAWTSYNPIFSVT